LAQAISTSNRFREHPVTPIACGRSASMPSCSLAVTDPLVLDRSIEPFASEEQDSTSDGELYMAITPEAGSDKKKKNRKSRPCKGKRLRYKKFVEQLQETAMAAPHLMDVQCVAWPPSLQNDFRKQHKLMMHLTECKLQQLKIQGEPCTVNPAPSSVPTLLCHYGSSHAFSRQ